MKIGIFDDDDGMRGDYARKIESANEGNPNVDVGILEEKEFLNNIEILNDMASRIGNEDLSREGTIFDEYDVLVIDKDLRLLKGASPFKSDSLVRLIRQFSRSKFILLIDQELSNVFDLRLVSDLRNYSDLYIGTNELDNSRLWGSSRSDEYRPWTFLNIPEVNRGLEERMEIVKTHLNEPILSALGLESLQYYSDDRIFESFPEKIEECTIKDFICNPEIGYGNREKENLDDLPSDVVAIFGASRIFKWLNGTVLQCQEAMIDAPHLIQRHPALYEGNPGKVNDLNQLTGGIDSIEIVMNTEAINNCRLPVAWSDRPVWLYKREDFRTIEEMESSNLGGHVFCEDSSSFMLEVDVTPYFSQLPARDDLRYVQDFDHKRYQPIQYLAVSR